MGMVTGRRPGLPRPARPARSLGRPRPPATRANAIRLGPPAPAKPADPRPRRRPSSRRPAGVRPRSGDRPGRVRDGRGRTATVRMSRTSTRSRSSPSTTRTLETGEPSCARTRPQPRRPRRARRPRGARAARRSCGCASGSSSSRWCSRSSAPGWCSCRASTPSSYAAMAAAEGMVAGRRCRPSAATSWTATASRWPTRSTAMMVVADPSLTADAGAGAGEVPRRPARRRLLRHPRRCCAPRTAASSTSPAGCPPRKATDVVDAAPTRPASAASTPRRDPMRDYPAGDVAANLIGFLGTDEPLGRLRAHLRRPARRHRRLGALRGRRRQPHPARRAARSAKPVNGTDLHTTIDRDLQWYTQRVLRQTVEDAGGESGVAVVMDTRTGELLALADDPTFDANDAAGGRRRRTSARAR